LLISGVIILKKGIKTYLTLFFATLKISAFTFGGGFVIIPMLRSKFVNSLHWIEDDEMLDLIAIAQSTPGAIAVNASVLIGYRIAGIRGAITTIFGTVIPPIVILSVVSLFYSAFRDNLIVSCVLKGMQAGVSAVIIDVVITMAQNIIKDKRIFPILIMIAAFVVTQVFSLNVIYIVIVCGTIGAIFMRPVKKEGKK
jgi:chromate transporter